jgi:CheY-like chemotaxis protein
VSSDRVILLAEDDEGHAALIRMSLREIGVTNQIIRLRNGEEVLKFLSGVCGTQDDQLVSNRYLLLLDLWMPKLDGMTALRGIREDARLSKLEVVILSTTDNPDEIEVCRSLRCADFLVKPTEYSGFTTLMKRVKRLLQSPSSRAECDA